MVILQFLYAVISDPLDFALISVSDDIEFIGDLAVCVHVECVQDNALNTTAAISTIHYQHNTSLRSLSNGGVEAVLAVEEVFKI